MLPKKYVYLCAVLISAVPVIAQAQSVQITSVSPTGAVNPGSVVSFIALQSGFSSPTYAVSDAYTGTGATKGTIDTVGYFSWTPTVYDGGWHAITVTVNDAQNHTATSTVNIRVASTVVLIGNLTPGPLVTVGKPVSFTLSAPGFTTPTYAVHDTSWRSTITPANVDASGTFTWTPTSDDIGTHTLRITASDPYGNQAQAIQTITVVNPGLSIQSLIPGTTAGVGQKVSFIATAAMLATTTTYSITDAFTGTSTAPAAASPAGVFSWTPSASDAGLHSLIVVAADGYGNTATTTVSILVTPASSVPAATLPTNTAVTASSGAPTASAATAYVFTKTIALGSRGAAVTALQNRLKALGLYTGPVSGYFGPMTAVSVRKFQKLHGLAQVGSVGPGTRAALNKQ